MGIGCLYSKPVASRQRLSQVHGQLDSPQDQGEEPRRYVQPAHVFSDATADALLGFVVVDHLLNAFAFLDADTLLMNTRSNMQIASHSGGRNLSVG